MVLAVGALMAAVYVAKRCRQSKRHLDIMKQLGVPSLDDCYHSERSPLTAGTDLYAHYGSRWKERRFTFKQQCIIDWGPRSV